MRAPFAARASRQAHRRSGEAAIASEEDLAAQLADLQEAVEALISAYGLNYDAVRSLQERRRAERGAFSRRLRLLWTEQSEGR